MRTFNITVNGQTYVVDVEEVGGVQTAAPVRAAAPVAAAPVAAAPAAAPKAAAAAPVAGGEPVKAPMPGNILDVKVKVGDTVKAGISRWSVRVRVSSPSCSVMMKSGVTFERRVSAEESKPLPGLGESW